MRHLDPHWFCFHIQHISSHSSFLKHLRTTPAPLFYPDRIIFPWDNSAIRGTYANNLRAKDRRSASRKERIRSVRKRSHTDVFVVAPEFRFLFAARTVSRPSTWSTMRLHCNANFTVVRVMDGFRWITGVSDMYCKSFFFLVRVLHVCRLIPKVTILFCSYLPQVSFTYSCSYLYLSVSCVFVRLYTIDWRRSVNRRVGTEVKTKVWVRNGSLSS